MTQQPLEPAPAPQIGTYRLLEPLGKGAVGEVHLALDSRLGRKGAIRLLPREFTGDAERVGRFQQEARTASALNQPNIVAIYELGTMQQETGTIRHAYGSRINRKETRP